MQLNHMTGFPDDTQRNLKVTNNNIRRLLMDFYNSDMDYAEVEFNHGEYSTSQSLYSGISKAIQKLELPIEARLIQGGVYLGRTD